MSYSDLERVELVVYVNRTQLNDHLGNTPIVTAYEGLKELVAWHLRFYEDSYGDLTPTEIDFRIEETRT